jgi:antitoxin SocA-like protein
MLDDTKLKELILHMAKQNVQDNWKFGAVKLNKLLFYSDFLSYLRRGVSITGQEYFAIQEGPAPRRMLPVTEKMICDGEFAYELIDVGAAKPLKKPLALRPPDYDKLDTQDVVIANEVIERFRAFNGTQLTALSHQFAGYIAAFAQGNKTAIPYAMARFDTKGLWGIETPSLPQHVIDHGKRLAEPIAA